MIRPRAVAAIDCAVGVQDEDGERLVGIELKEREIQAVGRDDADAHELLQRRLQPLVLIDQVVVELDALLARNAPQGHDERLASLFRLGEGLRQIVVDPEPRRFDLLLVRPNLLLAGLSGSNQREEDQTSQRNGR